MANTSKDKPMQDGAAEGLRDPSLNPDRREQWISEMRDQWQSEAYLHSEFHLRYEVVRTLGSGTFGRVYLVRPRDSEGEEYAAKVCDARAQNPDEIKQEYDVLKLVSGRKNCIRLVDAFFEEPYSYIITEICKRPLGKAILRWHAVSEELLAFYFRQAFSALAAVHEAGVVHRDIKVDNFLVQDPDATVKLIDFGLATREPRDDGPLTRVVGTSPYMSPEMVRADGYDKGTDVWSLGVSVYVCMLGHFPYKALLQKSDVMQAAIRLGMPWPTFTFADDVAGQLCPTAAISGAADGFLRAVLQRRPERRATAAEAVELQWLGQVSGLSVADMDPATAAVDLKASLRAAARVGAFSVGRVEPNEQVDRAMYELQTQSLDLRHYLSTRASLPPLT